MNKEYEEKKNEIKAKLQSFKNLDKKSKFKEFLFCLLTPQSNAQRCWKAVEEISNLKEKDYNEINRILKTKTRFHNTKTTRILKAYESWERIKDSLKEKDIKEIRNFLIKEVNGYGLKEASHFLRNIGLSNNKIAILDRHILKNLHSLEIIKEPKIRSRNDYLKIESIFLSYADSQEIQPDELDLLWWSKENGEIFK